MSDLCEEFRVGASPDLPVVSNPNDADAGDNREDDEADPEQEGNVYEVMLNHQLTDMNAFRALGRILGCCMRTRVTLDFDFCPIFWELLIRGTDALLTEAR